MSRKATILACLLTAAIGGPTAFAAEREVPQDAITKVRSFDGRFADIPTYREAVLEANARFDYAPILAGSWMRVLETFETVPVQVAAPAASAWTNLGLGSLVEVVLAEGCPSSLKEVPLEDPCGWRHTWIFQVRDSGEVVVLAEAGDSNVDPSLSASMR